MTTHDPTGQPPNLKALFAERDPEIEVLREIHARKW